MLFDDEQSMLLDDGQIMPLDDEEGASSSVTADDELAADVTAADASEDDAPAFGVNENDVPAANVPASTPTTGEEAPEPAPRMSASRRRLARLGLRSRQKRLTREEKRAQTRELFRRYLEEGDREARQEIIESNMDYVYFVASKYRDSNEPQKDLIQAGMVGLVEAVDRYDPSMGREFTTFAYSTIDGEIKHYFRDKGWLVRPPRNLQELSSKVRKTRDSLTSELNRTPTVSEIAERLGVSVDEVLRAMEASGAYSAVALEGGSDDDEDAPTVLDRYHDEDEDLASSDDRIVLEQVLGEFSEREQEVFRMRFDEGLKQVEIAERIGISQVQVSRLLRRMITKARELFDADQD